MPEILDPTVKKVAQAICQRERSGGQCKTCREAQYEYDPLTKDDVFTELGDGCLGFGFAYLAEVAIAAMSESK